MNDDDRENKDKIGNTLDYYNDEISRKAVGKLFNNVEDYDNQPQDGYHDRDRSSRRSRGTSPSGGDSGINNYYYDDNKSKDEEDDGTVVRGFSKGRNREDDYDYEDEAPRSTNRERYRRQFLDDYDRERGRTTPIPPREREERGDRYDRPSSSKSSMPQYEEELLPRRRRPSSLDEEDNYPKRNTAPSRDREYDRPQRSEGRYADDRDNREVKYTKIERVQQEPKRFERDGAQRLQESLKENNRFEKKQEVTNSDFIQTPLFKIMCGVVGVMLIIMVFLIVNTNGKSKKIVEFESKKAEYDKAMAGYAELEEQKKAAEISVNELDDKVSFLNLEIKRLKGEDEENNPPLNPDGTAVNPETQGTTPPTTTGKTHKVAPGETLSEIARKYFPGDENGMQKIMDANNLPSATIIQAGKDLKIPE